MATIAEQLTELAQGDSNIRSAIMAKGVAVPDATPFVQLGNKIAQIEGGGAVTPTIDYGWSRPADRPALPFGTEVPDNELYMLFGVAPGGTNDYGFKFGSYGGCIVDWGDGITETSAFTTTVVEHIYDYAALAITPNTNGIKWVWIKVLPAVSGAVITSIDMYTRHSSRPVASTTSYFIPQIYEIYVRATSCSSFITGAYQGYTRYALLDVFDWQGTNAMTGTWSGFLAFCHNLKKINLDISRLSALSYVLYAVWGSTPVDMDWLTTGVNLQSGTNNFQQSAYTGNVTIDVGNYNNNNISGILPTTNYGVTGVRLLNMNSNMTTIAVTGMNLSVDALVALFNDLYDRAGLGIGEITITGCFGAAALTEEQVNIAKLKNWGVTGAPSF